jgi:endo-beta-N-acetylglucosaminidase D
VVIAQRIANFPATQAHPDLSYGAAVLTLSGDYDGDTIRPPKYGDENDKYLFNFWQYLNYYGSWHGLTVNGSTSDYGVINPPQPAYTDAAHRNGVKSLGCWFFPRTGQNVSQWVQKAGNNYPVADKLIAMAQYYGFDGYFINQEDSTDPNSAAALNNMLSYMRARGLYIQWYDSLSLNGGISYQNEFNIYNQAWVKNGTADVANSIFLNYDWDSSKIQHSNALAKSLGLDPQTIVFPGVDSQSNGMIPPHDLALVFPKGIPGGLTGLGLFGSSDAVKLDPVLERIYWSGPNQNPAQSGRNTSYPNWDGIAQYITERSVIGAAPFVSSFNTGHGNAFYINGTSLSNAPWYNASAQDILPTWQWWTASSDASLTVDYDYSTAYNGGSSIKVLGALGPSNPTDLRLFKTDLGVTNGMTLAITYSSPNVGNTKVGLIFKDNPNTFVYLTIGGSANAGWNTKTFDLSSYTGRAIATIGLRFESPALTGFSMNIGQVAIKNSGATPPATPTGFAVENTYFNTDNTAAEVFLKWNMAASGVKYYDIYCLRTSGAREFLGRMYDEVYYIKNLNRNSEQSSTLQLVAVGFDGLESTAATAAVVWPGA